MKYVKIPIRNEDLDVYLESVKSWKIPESEKTKVKTFANDLRIGKVTGGQNKESTVISYLTNLRIALQIVNKKSSEIKEQDTEKLCSDLLRDNAVRVFRKKDEITKRIKKLKEPYAERGKIKIKRILEMYLTWALGDEAEKIVKILRLHPRLKEKTPDFLSEFQMEKLYKACKNGEERYAIAVLFDSGARAEEFHNIRKEDIELPKDKSNYVKLSLKEEYSKTKGRTISLYWKHSIEAVQEYLSERIKEGLEANEPIFKKSYRVFRKFLERMGQRALGRSIHYHLFRHSSATYYANKMNRQELSIRYGWSFRSPMPDRYINRSGVENKRLDEEFEQTNLQEIKKELEVYVEKDKMKSDKLALMEEKMEKLVVKLENLSKSVPQTQ